MYPKWDLTLLNKDWMTLQGIKKYRNQKNKWQDFSLNPQVLNQLIGFGWGPNKIYYFIKFRFEYTTKIHHIEGELFYKFKYDRFWDAEYTKDPLLKLGQPLPPNFQGRSVTRVRNVEEEQPSSSIEPTKKGEQNPLDTATTSQESSPKKRRRIHTLAQK